MNTTNIILGILILSSVAVAIYFDDMTVRLGAGAIFIIGSAFLYRSLAPTDTDETEEAVETKGHRADDESAFSQDNISFETATSSEIPLEYYRTEPPAGLTDDPRAEFDYLTNRLLFALKDHILAHSVAVFWINRDRAQIVIGECATDSRSFTTARRLPLGTDLVSTVGISGKPCVLPDIAPVSESDLLVYYDVPDGIQSFVGVPMYFLDEPIAVLAADSRVADAFGAETVATMGRFSTLITMLLGSYNHKFDLASDSKLLHAIEKMQRRITEQLDPLGIADATAEAVSEQLDWDYIAVIQFNPDHQKWTVLRSISKSSNLPYVREGEQIDMQHSVLREVLEVREGRIIDAPQPPHFRFHSRESIASSGQLCITPVHGNRKAVGFIVVEYRENHQYTQRDLDVIASIADIAGTYLNLIHLQELTRKHLLIDEATRVESRALIQQQLLAESQRVRAFGGSSIVLFVAVDSPDELLHKYGQEGLDNILFQIGQIVRSGIAAYDAVGKYDYSRFVTLLAQCSTEDAYLRAEKLRKAIAGHIMAYRGTSFSVTASIAGCTLSESLDAEQALKIAQQALDRAVADGGNCVKVV